MKNIGIALLGLGTVGSGVVKALRGNKQSLAGKLGANLELRHILVRDLHKQRGVQVDRALLTEDVNRILRDPAVNIVIEVMGGLDPAREYMLQAMAQGKHVVSANKEVVAKFGRELLAAAERHKVGFYFEASVAGAIPIIRSLKQCLAANEVEELMGIINGTTNYILSKMATEGREFNVILREAQEKGYAEPDPTSDVEGFDAAYKLAILASLAFGTNVRLEDIRFEGISRISREDMSWAAALGYTVKLLAVAREHPRGLEVRVGPSLLPLSHPLAKVNDVFNGVLVKGNLAGELMFTGRGAGDLPTASAVVADIIAAARLELAGEPAMPACSCYRYKPVLPQAEIASPYYLRVSLSKTESVLPVNKLLLQEQAALNPVVKKLNKGSGGTVIFFIRPLKGEQISQLAGKISSLPGVKEISLLHVEGGFPGEALAAEI